MPQISNSGNSGLTAVGRVDIDISGKFDEILTSFLSEIFLHDLVRIKDDLKIRSDEFV